MNIELRVGDVWLRSAPNDRTVLVSGKDGTKALDLEWRVDGTTIIYDGRYTIPAEMLAASREISVDIIEDYIDPRHDDFYYNSVLEPTEDFSLICVFSEDVRLELQRVTLENPEQEPPIGEGPHYGHGTVTINGWLLPGHGAVVAWFGLEGEAPATTTAVSANHDAESPRRG